MRAVRFTRRYQSSAEILTGPPGPDDTFRRVESGEPVAGSGMYVSTERVQRGRVFIAEAGDIRELTDEQAAYLERDSPGVIERVVVGAGTVSGEAITHPARAEKR